MAVFKYKAKTKKGEIKEGVVIAGSKKEAGDKLKGEQLSPLSIQAEKSRGKKSGLFSRKVNLLDKANLCRYLSTMINSGLPLSEAVDVISTEVDNPQMKQIMVDVRESIQGGRPLSGAFAKHPQVFDEIFLTLIEAGEKSGTLGKSFGYLGDQLYSDYELRRKIVSTLAYPFIIVLTTMGLGVAMLLFVVPKIAPILLNLDREFPLPPYTLFILKTGLFLSQNVLYLLGFVILVVVGLLIFFSKPKGKKILGNFLSRIPFFGQLFVKLVLGRFNRTLATLLKSGVPIIDSIKVSAKTLTLPQYKDVEKTLVKKIEKGVSLAKILRESKAFPSIMIRMVSTGEKTGSLDKLLLDLAQFYEEEVSNSLKTLTSVIEPILMLFIGLGVAVMVVSVIAPIYSFVGSLSKSLSSH